MLEAYRQRVQHALANKSLAEEDVMAACLAQIKAAMLSLPPAIAEAMAAAGVCLAAAHQRFGLAGDFLLGACPRLLPYVVAAQSVFAALSAVFSAYLSAADVII